MHRRATAAGSLRRADWRRLAAGLAASALLHGVVLIALGLPLPAWIGGSAAGVPEQTIQVVATRGTADHAVAAAAAAPITIVSPVDASLVLERLDEVISQSEQCSPAEKLARLQQLVGRLELVSDDRSIDELAMTFHQWFGTERRATEPAATPVAGPFDFSTAQLYEVRREPRGKGQWQYWSVLLDAQGRLQLVELTEAEGQLLYSMMQQLRKSPLAEKLYRKVAMPLLDKLAQIGQDADAP